MHAYVQGERLHGLVVQKYHQGKLHQVKTTIFALGTKSAPTT